MEEEKAAAYYDELSRKGEGAARFKRGLGFSSSSSPSGGGNTSSNSFASLSGFVRASTGAGSADVHAIHQKLQKKPPHPPPPPRSRRSRSRSQSRSPRRDVRRSRARSPRRSRSRSRSPRRERARRRSPVSPSSRRSHGRSRSRSPSRGDRQRRERKTAATAGSNAGNVDYARLIAGYDSMTPAERVKAKMRLQLKETAAKDTTREVGWERFDFNKDAPLDDDNEIEVADDDASIVKNIGRSFRFTAVEANREEALRVAHDEAMFGASSNVSVHATEASVVDTDKYSNKDDELVEQQPTDSIVSDQVLVEQQGSWRDRARRFRGDRQS